MRGTSSKKSLFFAFESVLYSVCSKLIMQYARHLCVCVCVHIESVLYSVCSKLIMQYARHLCVCVCVHIESVLCSVCSKLIMQYVRHIFSKGPLW